MEEDRPTIEYCGTGEQPLHSNAQYLLMKAEIGNGVHDTQEFVRAVEEVSLRGVEKAECRCDLENTKQYLRIFSKLCDLVTIRNFKPDRERLEYFVNTTFSEMHAELYGLS